MNYLDEAKQRLQDYNLKCCGAENLKANIARLEALNKITVPLVDSGEDLSFTGGLMGRDQIYNNMAFVVELKENLITTQRQIERIKTALNQIDEHDRMIVERLIINHETADDLAAELFVTKRTVYYHRDRALRRFALAYYGIEA